ncbi:hypothetical protein OPV22_015552 [Ensete ventricosum]|uniref:Uncharacterized protein n=1 Tax=Ensete ventricosum TaxID=4639 RepID=A0AAV8REH2_ENSVE|nr:hypothetical protein OPV22_015552 [Ensete ventricosum]
MMMMSLEKHLKQLQMKIKLQREICFSGIVFCLSYKLIGLSRERIFLFHYLSASAFELMSDTHLDKRLCCLAATAEACGSITAFVNL